MLTWFLEELVYVPLDAREELDECLREFAIMVL